nr:T9SS type A sorting domain-containing protein [Aquimarina agarilytica]
MYKKSIYFADANGNPFYSPRFVGTNKASTMTIGSEATMVLRYHFKNNINVNQTSNETKHYATRNAASYLEYIEANQNQNFNINIGNKPQFGEATLRIGVGRAHNLQKLPRVFVNGTEINSAKQWRGSGVGQGFRERFHSIVEVDVPLSVLKANGNNVSVRFPDAGGFITSMALQVFRMTANIRGNVGAAPSTPTTGNGSGIPIGQVISLQKSGGDLKYLSAVAELNNDIYANQSQALGNRQKFRVVNHPDGGIALYNLNAQRYLQVNGNNQNVIVGARGAQTKGWERFEWKSKGAGKVAFKSLHTGKWLQAPHNQNNTAVFPRGNADQGWETFNWKVVPASANKILATPTISTQAKILIYPNPVDAGQKITVANTIENTTINVLDVSGNLVNSIKATQGISFIETTGLTAGIYFINIEGEEPKRIVIR